MTTRRRVWLGLGLSLSLVGCGFRFQDTFDNAHALYAGDVGIGINPALAHRIGTPPRAAGAWLAHGLAAEAGGQIRLSDPGADALPAGRGRDEVDAPVVVPRDLLEPTTWEVTIATVDDADRAYAELDTKPGSWGELIAGADRMLQVLADCSLLDFSLDGYVPLKVGVVLLRGPGSATFFVESLVERLRTPDTPPLPLLQALVTRADDQPLISQRDQLAQSRRHVAQMNGQHKLAESQREALLHHLADRTGTILAVDGPPGTGKTTLLLSVIANAWVEAALREGEPPIVVAASCNNQGCSEHPARVLRDSGINRPALRALDRWLADLRSLLAFQVKRVAGRELPGTCPEKDGEGLGTRRAGIRNRRRSCTRDDGVSRACAARLARRWPGNVGQNNLAAPGEAARVRGIDPARRGRAVPAG